MKNMKFLTLTILLLGFMSCQTGDEKETITEKITGEQETTDINMKADDVPESGYFFAELPYAADALEPYIDAEIMKLHYGKHHKGYYKKFLKAIEGTSAANESLSTIFSGIDNYDDAVRNNSGGYYNHWVYWDNMTPDETEPSSELKAAIEKSFGSMDEFETQFKAAATSQFGSGWAWLIMDPSDKLLITNTPNQDNPLMGTSKQQGYPLLTIDVWEHAYYLQYKNERGSYVDAFMNVIDWDEVSRRYKMAQNGNHYVPGK